MPDPKPLGYTPTSPGGCWFMEFGFALFSGNLATHIRIDSQEAEKSRLGKGKVALTS